MSPSRWGPPTAGQAGADGGGRGADGAVLQGEQFVYREDWGEALSTRSVPVLCVLDIEGSSVSVLEGVPEHLSPGQVRTGCRGSPRGPAWGCGTIPAVAQALWSPGDTGVLFVGWWHEPFRLGLSACSNRRWVPPGTQRRAGMPTPCRHDGGSARPWGSSRTHTSSPGRGFSTWTWAAGTAVSTGVSRVPGVPGVRGADPLPPQSCCRLSTAPPAPPG